MEVKQTKLRLQVGAELVDGKTKKEGAQGIDHLAACFQWIGVSSADWSVLSSQNKADGEE